MIDRLWQRGRAVIAALLVFCALSATVAQAGDSLIWHSDSDRVDAEIAAWSLSRLLENIAAATGWRIYVEPETKHTVSTKFKHKIPGDALRLLLGDLSFALVPQSEGAPKLFVFRTSVQEATQLVQAKKEPEEAKPIPNELVVTLKPGADIDELARQLGAKVTGRIDKLRTYRLEFEDEEAARRARERLSANDDVESVDFNYPVFRPPAAQSLTFSSAGPLSLRPKAIGGGDQLIIGLIDTAVQRQGTALDDFLLSGISLAGEATSNDLYPSHGSAMFETILRGLQSALDGDDGSRVRVLPVDIYGNKASSSTFDVALGIYEAINRGATIINLSLSSAGGGSVLHDVIQSGREQGVRFFAAAGNEPVPAPQFPAAYPEVIAVTAGDRSGNIAPYANYGEFVDLIAPGSSLVIHNGRPFLIMGTSAATAYASGLAAGLADGSQRSLTEVEALILKALAVKRSSTGASTPK